MISHALFKNVLNAAEEQPSTSSFGLPELMAASRAVDRGLAKEAAEALVLQGLLDQGRRLSVKLRERVEAVSRSCIDT